MIFSWVYFTIFFGAILLTFPQIDVNDYDNINRNTQPLAIRSPIRRLSIYSYKDQPVGKIKEQYFTNFIQYDYIIWKYWFWILSIVSIGTVYIVYTSFSDNLKLLFSYSNEPTLSYFVLLYKILFQFWLH